MTYTGEPLVFSTQGDELSYHAQAVREYLGDMPVSFMGKDTFPEVIRSTRNDTNLGAIAICTVAGTVDDSAREIVCQRPAALPKVVGRQDVEVKLALIGSSEQTIDELQRPGVRCLGQKAALLQCETFFAEQLPRLKRRNGQYRKESIKAVREALERKDPGWIALGPNHAANALGGFVLGPSQVNPPESVTSFYVLQQEQDASVLPEYPDRTEPRAVVSIAHPEGKGEFAKCLELAESLGIRISRFIPFAIGDFTKHDKDVRRGGGIFELAHKEDSGIISEFAARIAVLEDNNGFHGPFNIRILGGFRWYDEPDVEPELLIPDDDQIPETEINIDRFVHDLDLNTAKLRVALLTAKGRDLERILSQVAELNEVIEQAFQEEESTQRA